MNEKAKHLEMIQAVVTRLGVNSFLLKGWSVTLISVLFFALAAASSNPSFFHVAFLPAFVFWLLDGYYLRQERLFRALYDRIRQLPGEGASFSIATDSVGDKVAPCCVILFSTTILLLHGAILAAILVAVLI